MKKLFIGLAVFSCLALGVGLMVEAPAMANPHQAYLQQASLVGQDGALCTLHDHSKSGLQVLFESLGSTLTRTMAGFIDSPSEHTSAAVTLSQGGGALSSHIG